MRNPTNDTEKCLFSFSRFPSTRVLDCGLLSKYNRKGNILDLWNHLFGISCVLTYLVPCMKTSNTVSDKPILN